jgi:hypothetical protein
VGCIHQISSRCKGRTHFRQFLSVVDKFFKSSKQLMISEVSPLTMTSSTGIERQMSLKRLFVFEKAPKGCHVLSDKVRKYVSPYRLITARKIRTRTSHGIASKGGGFVSALPIVCRWISGQGKKDSRPR